MKKFLLPILLSINVALAHADFIHLDLLGKNIPTEDAINHFAEWFHTGHSTFKIFNERYDNIGYKHQNYHQYVDGIKVEDCALFVHSKGGYVTYINGDIMPIANNPKSEVKISTMNAKKKVGSESQEEPEIVLMYKQFQDTSIFYKTYKVVTDTAQVYVDVQSGEIIAVYPTISYEMRDCTMPTMYSGVQNVSCNYTNSKYYLYDSNRKINVRYADMLYYNAHPETSYSYTSTTNDWSGAYLTSLTIKSINNDWWGVLGLENPDLYVEVLDQYGNQLYITDYKEDVSQFPVTFRFSEAIRVPSYGGLIIRIYDYDAIEDQLGEVITLSSGALGVQSWGSTSSNTYGSLVISNSVPSYDAYWGAIKTYDFYKNIFGLSSFDGNNSNVNIYFHTPHMIKKEGGNKLLNITLYDNYYLNAYADDEDANSSKAYLFFGVGNERGYPQVGLNTITHEYTHLVTAFRPNEKLVYQGESGAINEGYSDVMAEVAEYYITGSNDWLYDTESDLWGFAFLRDISNPKNAGPEGPKPTTYGKGDYWVDPNDTDKDNGGVHANNSIFTYWFYLLSEGGKGTNDNNHSYEVKGIGIEKAAKIAWQMHREYLPKKCSFKEARELSIQSVRDLSDGVIGTPAEKAVVNAWHAVGVGDKYVEEPTTSSNQFLVLAQRKTGGNWFYMTADLGTAGTKRFQAIDAGTSVKEDINRTPDGEKYLWSFEDVAGGVALKNGTQYATWNAGNSAILSSTPKAFSVVDAGEDIVNISFVDGDGNTRYLSLNATEGNNYFAFYKGTTQKYNLLIIPYGEQQPPIEEPKEEFVVLAQRNNTSNWFYMTADLGTAGTKRFQAVDAGTPNKSMINTSPTDSKYIWSFEEVAGGIALVNEKQYASWKSGNSAILSTTPMALNITDISDDQVNMSFVDNEGNTRYLSLNATVGNNYFAFYKGTTQKCNLLVIPYGEKITTELETITLTETPIVQKIMRDGQLLILRDGKTYNVMGQEL